jgi:hypothetical protein
LPFLPVEFTTLGENEMDAQSRINVRCSWCCIHLFVIWLAFVRY